MNAIFADPMVYGSAAAVLAGIAAFPFVFKKYRAAGPAEESPLPGMDMADDKEEGPIPVEPVKKKEAAPLADAADKTGAPPPQAADKTMKMSPEAAEKAVNSAFEAAKPTEPPAKDPAPRRGMATATTTGGISPAVVYLQNLKIQMEHFEKEVQGLRTQLLGFAQKQDKESQKHDKEFLVLLKTMGDFQKEVREQMNATQSAVQQVQVSSRAAAAVQEPEPPARGRRSAKSAQAPARSPEPEPELEAAPLAEAAVPAEVAAPVEVAAPTEVPVLEPASAEPEPAPARASEPMAWPVEPPAGETPQIETEAPAPEPAQEAPAVAPAQEAIPPAAEDIAATLTLTLPDAVEQEPSPAAPQPPEAEVSSLTLEPAVPATQAPEDDPLRPSKSKGPVWPV